MSDGLLQLQPLGQVLTPSASDRARLERRARHLAWGGIAWHFVEFAIAIAIAAGLAASSIARDRRAWQSSDAYSTPKRFRLIGAE